MVDKRYFWLKLNEKFFEDETIRYIEEQENGFKYSNIYLKLLLKSIHRNGVLIRQVGTAFIPYDKAAIAKMTNHDVDTVVVAMNLFKNFGLIEELDSGALFMTQLDAMIGSEGASAARVRALRQKRANELPEVRESTEDALHCNTCVTEKALQSVTEPLQESYTDVTEPLQTTSNCNSRYIEYRDKSLDKEKEYTVEPKGSVTDGFDQPVSEIIDYLNEKLGTKYKPGSKCSQRHIVARLKEGYSVEDFQKVIDKKCAQWMGSSMAKYLRPETLFGSKFEGYLNEQTYSQPEEPKFTLWDERGNL